MRGRPAVLARGAGAGGVGVAKMHDFLQLPQNGQTFFLHKILAKHRRRNKYPLEKKQP